MNVKIAAFLIVIVLGIVFPILGMSNCEFENAATMAVKNCHFDHPVLAAYAEFYWGWFMLSPMMLFLPIIAYLFFLKWIYKFLGTIFTRHT